MRVILRSALAVAALVALSSVAPLDARAGASVNVLVLKEHGVGSAAQAQPFVDKFVARAAQQNGWAAASGKFVTTRVSADAYVKSDAPHFGILSLAAFLAMKSPHNLEVIGQVNSARAGGQEYHLISKTAADLAGCKGKTLATDHGDDPKFIEKVVAGGKFKLGDFTLVTTTRPVQTINKVVDDSAVCALIDDAQLAQLPTLQGVAGIKSVWKSDKLPAMVMVAFPASPAAERKGFQGNLTQLCSGAGQQDCTQVGVQSFASATVSTYATVIAAYDKP